MPHRPVASRYLTTALAGAVVLLLSLAVQAAPMPYGKGVLWRIDRPGIAPSHVFGTVHLTDPRVLALPQPVRRALNAARSLSVEVVQNSKTQAQMAQMMVLRDGSTLDTILGKKLFDATAGAAAQYGLPASTVRRLKPWAAMTMLALPPAELTRQAAGHLPLDRALVADARRRGVAIHALESVTEQLSLFDGLARPHQIALLRQLVREHHRTGEIHARMVAYYLARDVEGMLSWMLRQSAGEDPHLQKLFWERFVDSRNRKMTRRMQARLTGGAAFIAIGAAHLPGKAGILNLLAGSGWRVARVY